jgi:hypothetical protein
MKTVFLVLMLINLSIAQSDITEGESRTSEEKSVSAGEKQFPAISDSISSDESTQEAVVKPQPQVMTTNKMPGKFNPLCYGTRISLAFQIPYFYYQERIPLRDVAQSFKDQYGHLPDTIDGAPRSTEYGISPGLNLRFTKIFPRSGIMIRPQISAILGIQNTYDGSLQGQAVTNKYGDTIGVKYKPYDTVKTNIIVGGEFDLGYSRSDVLLPFVFFSGIRFNLWHRDMGSNLTISNYENYTWASIPIGFDIYKSIGSRRVAGMEFVVDCMVYGGMKAQLHLRGINGGGLDYPQVQLGKKAGYRLELMYGNRLGENLFLQFMPFASIYGFGKSNTEYATIKGSSGTSKQNRMEFYEPASSTFLAGLNISMNFLRKPFN